MVLFLLVISLFLHSAKSSHISSTSTTLSSLISSTTPLAAAFSFSSENTLKDVIGNSESNVTRDDKAQESQDLKQSALAGLDIRWGGERGNHNLVLGKKQDRDELLLRYVCRKDGRWLRTVTDEVMWPLYGKKPTSHIIHYVEALDQEVGGRGGFASITKGSIGSKNITITLKSQRNYGLNFIVSIYGSPEYHETYEDTIVINEKPDKYGIVHAYKPRPDYGTPLSRPDYATPLSSSAYGPPPPPASAAPPSQEYGIDSYQPNSYRPQLGYETNHHAYKPNYGHTHEYSPIDNNYNSYESEESNEDTVSVSNPGIYIEQHQYKPSYNPYKPNSGAVLYRPQSNLNAELYLSSKPKPNVYTHNVEAYKPGEYYVHHQQNYYAKPQNYRN